jgi:hypothetical protein
MHSQKVPIINSLFSFFASKEYFYVVIHYPAIMFRTFAGPVTIILTFLAVTLLTSEDAQAVDIDLEPVNFTFSPDYPIRGEGLEISFEVVNNGLEPANNVRIVHRNATLMTNVFPSMSLLKRL